ncbi:hypothetical protein MPSEU_000284200 [Mayamaea pseudoterrestris]|nr:hypothetical protein MPSEU_000284200 [Mayamaea pseudoterrestris]
MTTEPPPHKTLGRDFFLVGAQLAPDEHYPGTNTLRVINTTIHKTQQNNRLVSISDWLLQTLQYTPYFLLRMARRAVPRGSGCCLLDFGGMRHMLVLLGDCKTKIPAQVPQLTVSVKIGKHDDDLQERGVTCSLQDSVWEHVLVAIDQNGSEHATRIFIMTEDTGVIGRDAISSSTCTTHLWCKNDDTTFHVDRSVNYATLTEALEQEEEMHPAAAASNKRAAAAAAAAASQSNTATKKKRQKAATETKAEEEGEAESKQNEPNKETKKQDKAASTKTKDAVDSATSTPDAGTLEEPVANDIVLPKNGKKKKDPKLPKGPQSAYNCFFGEKMAESRREQPDESAQFHTKQVAMAWKELSDEDKKKYQQMSDKDHERYRAEMETYVPSSNASDDEQDKPKKKKQKKDPDAPKKPMTAYIAFCNETRPGLKNSHPEKSFGELTKIVSEAWGKLSTEEKQKYNAAAKDAKDKYEDDKMAFANSKAEADGDSVKPTAKATEKKGDSSKITSAKAKGTKVSAANQKTAKSPAKKGKTADEDGSVSSKNSKANTVGEDSDSESSSTDSESVKDVKPTLKAVDKNASRLTASDDDTDEDGNSAPTVTTKKAMSKSTVAAKKPDKSDDSSSVSDDDTDDEDKKTPKAATKKAMPASPMRGGKGKAQTTAPETPKRSARNKDSSSLAIKAEKKRRKSEGGKKKDRKSKRESKSTSDTLVVAV